MKTIRNWLAIALTFLTLLWGPVVYNAVTGTIPAPVQYHLINGGGGGGECC